MLLSSKYGKRENPIVSHSATIFPFPALPSLWHDRDRRSPGAADPTGASSRERGSMLSRVHANTTQHAPDLLASRPTDRIPAGALDSPLHHTGTDHAGPIENASD